MDLFYFILNWNNVLKFLEYSGWNLNIESFKKWMFNAMHDSRYKPDMLGWGSFFLFAFLFEPNETIGAEFIYMLNRQYTLNVFTLLENIIQASQMNYSCTKTSL